MAPRLDETISPMDSAPVPFLASAQMAEVDRLRAPDARERAGELYVADIGVPPALYARAPVNVVVGDLFSGQDVIRVW